LDLVKDCVMRYLGTMEYCETEQDVNKDQDFHRALNYMELVLPNAITKYF